jgi:hypothetical protein
MHPSAGHRPNSWPDETEAGALSPANSPAATVRRSIHSAGQIE